MSNQARQVLSIYRFILRTLRHHAEAYHLYVDSRCWVSIKQLLQLINARSLELQLWRNWTATDLQRQASMDDRQRIEINDHYVRALYGHSLAHVSAGIPESPPHTLYHGTSVASLPEIAVQGLLPGTRCDVHLTSDLDYARLVSATHSDACVLVVRTDGPVRSGTLYRRANRHVWLTRCIPPESVSVLETVSATPAALRYIQQFNSIRQLNCVEVH
ncbi:MAG: RNA 2'-phosphotransferase [Planctomycetaceae bacterium]